MLEPGDEGRVVPITSLPGPKTVVEVADGVREVEPFPVVRDEIDVRRLRKRVGSLIPAVTLDGKLGAGSGIDELGHPTGAAKLGDRKGACDIHVVYGAHILLGSRDSSIFSQMVDDRWCLRYQGIHILGVSPPVLRSGDMVGLSSVGVVVQRDDPVAGIGD